MDERADRSEASQSTAPANPARSRDLRGRRHHPWVRRLLLAAMLALVLVALSGRLGQPEHATAVRDHPAATIDLRAPTVLRAGLLWRARIAITARRRIRQPQVVLGAGYVRGMQLNTLEPAATDEASAGEKLALTYPTLDAGELLILHLQLQVNPTTRGRQDLSVALNGEGVGPEPVRLRATTTVLP